MDKPKDSADSWKSHDFMQTHSRLAPLSFPEIVRRCQEETNRYIQKKVSDDRYCFELFRRALDENLSEALGAIYTQYSPLIHIWLRQGKGLAQIDEPIDGVIGKIFDKFWMAMSQKKFADFPTLKALLAYLKMTTGTVVLDYLRAIKPATIELPPELPASDCEKPGEQLSKEELLEQIKLKLNDDDEKLVFFAMYTLGMKPREIHSEWSERFSSVQRVNQIRQNIVERLRRDDELQRYYHM